MRAAGLAADVLALMLVGNAGAVVDGIAVRAAGIAGVVWASASARSRAACLMLFTWACRAAMDA